MEKSVRILLLEDQESDALLAKREIKKIIPNYEVEWVDNREDFIKALNEFNPEIIISDFRMPSFDGLSALKIKQDLKPKVPFIMFTGSINEDTAVACMKAGAADYIIKEHLKRLGPAIVSALEQNAVREAKQKAEIDLALSEERYHRMAENVPDMIYRIKMIPFKSFEYINKACESITGYSVEEFCNDPTLGERAIHPDDLKILDEKINSGQYFFKPLLTRLIRKDGKIIWFEQRNIPIFDEKGSLIAVEGIAQDVTEKRNSEILKQAIFEIAQAASSVTSLKDIYSEVHRIVMTIMPASNFYIALYDEKQDLIDFPYFIDETDSKPEARKPKRGFTEYVLNSGKSLLCDENTSESLIKKGMVEQIGQPHSIWLGVPLTFVDKTIGVMVVQHYSDPNAYGEKEKEMLEYVSTQVAKAIIHRKNQEQIQEKSDEIERQNEELQVLVQELNRNYLELEKAKEKAEESDKLKTAFLQNMSHEIRTPMNAIMGFSELMELNLDQPNKLKFYTKVIQQRSNDLLDIINELLDIARIESGQLTLKEEAVNLNTLINELQSIYALQTDLNVGVNIKLIVKDIPKYINSTILSDNAKLKQIFTNLINNALKFTDEGSIEFGFHSVTNEMITFYVADTGTGISQNMHDLIFERFRKSIDESTYVKDGIGLGLTIVKGILTQMKGKIWLESEVKKGSTFYFSIPYTPHWATTPDQTLNEDQHFDWSNKTILIVEDDPSNSSYFIELLEGTNISYLIGITGKNALSILKDSSNNFDIVLMDIKLPDISGYDLTKEFKNLHPNIPIIAQTAYASRLDRTKALNAGCDDFIAKPIKRNELLLKIDRFLK